MGKQQAETHDCNVKIRWTGGNEGNIALQDKQPLPLTSPTQWDGRSDYYSPQDLFVSAVAGCFITTFASVMNRMKQRVKAHEVTGRAVLHKHPEGGWHFTDIFIVMDITVFKEANLSQIKRAVTLTEKYCQVSRSVASKVHVESRIKQIE